MLVQKITKLDHRVSQLESRMTSSSTPEDVFISKYGKELKKPHVKKRTCYNRKVVGGQCIGSTNSPTAFLHTDMLNHLRDCQPDFAHNMIKLHAVCAPCKDLTGEPHNRVGDVTAWACPLCGKECSNTKTICGCSLSKSPGTEADVEARDMMAVCFPKGFPNKGAQITKEASVPSSVGNPYKVDYLLTFNKDTKLMVFIELDGNSHSNVRPNNDAEKNEAYIEYALQQDKKAMVVRFNYNGPYQRCDGETELMESDGRWITLGRLVRNFVMDSSKYPEKGCVVYLFYNLDKVNLKAQEVSAVLAPPMHNKDTMLWRDLQGPAVLHPAFRQSGGHQYSNLVKRAILESDGGFFQRLNP